MATASSSTTNGDANDPVANDRVQRHSNHLSNSYLGLQEDLKELRAILNRLDAKVNPDHEDDTRSKASRLSIDDDATTIFSNRRTKTLIETLEQRLKAFSTALEQEQARRIANLQNELVLAQGSHATKVQEMKQSLADAQWENYERNDPNEEIAEEASEQEETINDMQITLDDAELANERLQDEIKVRDKELQQNEVDMQEYEATIEEMEHQLESVIPSEVSPESTEPLRDDWLALLRWSINNTLPDEPTLERLLDILGITVRTCGQSAEPHRRFHTFSRSFCSMEYHTPTQESFELGRAPVNILCRILAGLPLVVTPYDLMVLERVMDARFFQALTDAQLTIFVTFLDRILSSHHRKSASHRSIMIVLASSYISEMLYNLPDCALLRDIARKLAADIFSRQMFEHAAILRLLRVLKTVNILDFEQVRLAALDRNVLQDMDIDESLYSILIKRFGKQTGPSVWLIEGVATKRDWRAGVPSLWKEEIPFLILRERHEEHVLWYEKGEDGTSMRWRGEHGNGKGANLGFMMQAGTVRTYLDHYEKFVQVDSASTEGHHGYLNHFYKDQIEKVVAPASSGKRKR